MATHKKARSRRGPVPLSESEKRTHTVSVRMNESELAWLDEQRSKINMKRGEYLRAASMGKLPPVIPEVNRLAWVSLSRAASNLNQIGYAFNYGEEQFEQVVDALSDFRCALISAKGSINES